ncbi:MAG: deoxyribodipyrimidine photo-lyase [Deltaproteobacteria bacterium]
MISKAPAPRRRVSPAANAAADPSSRSADPRLHVLNAHDPARDGAYVLYWCRAYRRASDNLALDHAVRRADELGVPLLVYEALDVRYPHASDRIHRFVLEGACEMRAPLEARGIGYAFFLPRTAAEARDSKALERLAARACCVVTDWYPDVGGPRSLWAHTRRLAARLSCRMEAYDDAVVVPMSLLGKPEVGARTIRPKVHAALDAHLVMAEDRTPRHAMRALPALPFEPTDIVAHRLDALVAACHVDHDVAPVADRVGGPHEARARLERFTTGVLRHYAEERNDMARVAVSGLSPYLHFGHLSVRAVALVAREEERGGDGRDAFLEQLIVRRSLAFNWVMNQPLHTEYASVPAWARDQLAKHADDPRPLATDFSHWLAGETGEALWNAAQRELLRDGVIHPYARMLWGKVAITLAKNPEDAFAWLVELNDRFALDGRDPNTYASIAWCFGLHDRPFPGRAIFGTVRSMTTRSAAHKWDVSTYLARVGMAGASLTTGQRDEFDQRTLWDD